MIISEFCSRHVEAKSTSASLIRGHIVEIAVWTDWELLTPSFTFTKHSGDPWSTPLTFLQENPCALIMSTVEAAASLFGADDPAADPFATLGADTTSPSVNDDLVENPGQPDVSQIFDTTIQDSSNLFDAEVPFVQEVSQYHYEPTTHDAYSYDSSAYSQSLSTGYSNDDVPAQTSYDAHNQWPTHEQPVVQASSSGGSMFCTNQLLAKTEHLIFSVFQY